ncbi:hypothetical protein [Wenyingzhuangia sp. 2_MG-2023]|uniref:hypothetical protein n=1 Tax=Wenyingzhuangia sp. 2_MG-2023 TaxID=3062639 RepID=UPI0026E3D646|nr:hypothetical protein [Wenyingzhuangia sp. 2_MG-2023]MDO6738433.1 hypothetical protein [Wenyingzhuangia sp. 2_MG-2023]
MSLKNNKPKIAIIEFDTSHAECIYSQILFLKDTYNITVFINKNSLSIIPDLAYITKKPLELDSKKEIKKTSIELKQQLISGNFVKVIINSAERKIFKFLLLFLFNTKISFWGILHNPNRLKSSLKQKIISKKLKGYFVLSDFIKQNIQKEKLTKTKTESTYLIFFDEKVSSNSNVIKSANETWILIPGKVQSIRRDYSFLLQFQEVPKNIKFIILGNINTEEGISFKKELSKTSYSDQFHLFENHVPDTDFYEYIALADFMLPLVHPNNKLFEKYIKYKVTGTYNWAYSFQKTMLLEQHFSQNKEFKETSYFYDFRNPKTFFKILENPKKQYSKEKWSLEHQKNKYLNFIEQTL